MLWVLITLGVVAVMAVTTFVACCIAGGQSEERRGGVLELDTWEARKALRLRDGELATVRAEARFLGRCGHLVSEGCDYVVRQHDGARFCSPRCATVARSSRGIRPFAGGSGDAA